MAQDTSGCGIIRSIDENGTENVCGTDGLCIVCKKQGTTVVTFVPSENGTTTITTQVNDTVYVRNSRNGTYKNIAHRVSRFSNGLAVTYCTIWCRAGTVMPLESDCFTWCTNGCKPHAAN